MILRCLMNSLIYYIVRQCLHQYQLLLGILLIVSHPLRQYLLHYIPAIRQSQIYMLNVNAKLSYFCNYSLGGSSSLHRIRRFRRNAGRGRSFRRPLWKFFPLTFSCQSAKPKKQKREQGRFPAGKAPLLLLLHNTIYHVPQHMVKARRF